MTSLTYFSRSYSSVSNASREKNSSISALYKENSLPCKCSLNFGTPNQANISVNVTDALSLHKRTQLPLFCATEFWN